MYFKFLPLTLTSLHVENLLKLPTIISSEVIDNMIKVLAGTLARHYSDI